jgi:hypothetical protein
VNASGALVFPPEILLGDARFRKAVIRESKPGAIEQYREVLEESSQHLLVRSDGTWIIDHSDDVNPDMGGPTAPIRHFFADHPLAPVAAIGVIGLALFAASRIVRS